ncbi:peptide-methionine (S)-S-oxidereductase [Monoraphidium neglectum]|uniref:peptide-methionine (S)-S-oxide reductase n=1 Tax=Monoraphidium neglectum TaxID=145388 RepID=A0A0D2J9R3_9CHLO|nr:peptide-methionine (S)-S-oxidereductase [Monoraphidium neglectum]KIY96497.1 peptide-methionine (S)-S-oxidereductase [Monoraphidium neglectum]|eukprot:XP_013895517.1 peptide-methionine (S)-S-oxidereductase [Monoraphidium neglectum]
MPKMSKVQRQPPPSAPAGARLRGSLAVSAMFGFNWPWAGSKDGEKKEGKFDSILKAARTARRGCPLAPKEAPPGLKLATFAGGCFWGLELAYQRVPGVVSTSVGYTGGRDDAPTYESVCMGFTGHTEAVQVTYDPKEVTYRKLLDTFFERVDPTTRDRQGSDRGSQYRSAIFAHDEEQRQEAEAKLREVRAALEARAPETRRWLGRGVVTPVEGAGDYYVAESYHQQYLAKGGRFGQAQSAEKGNTDTIRCYG